jgi:CheY-like chemotaxis protein
MILNLLEYTFSSRDGYNVASFRKGEDCIAAMYNNPDLVVLDHSFLIKDSAFTNGLQILCNIRTNGSNVPVIVLSGEEDPEIIEKYNSKGVNKFIRKDSFFIDSLIESIDEVLSEA